MTQMINQVSTNQLDQDGASDIRQERPAGAWKPHITRNGFLAANSHWRGSVSDETIERRVLSGDSTRNYSGKRPKGQLAIRQMELNGIIVTTLFANEMNFPPKRPVSSVSMHLRDTYCM